MKKILFLVVLMYSLPNIFAQNAVSSYGKFSLPYETVEVKPEFDGGYIAFVKFIAANFVLPEVESLSGSVKVSFVIDTDGKIGNIQVLSDLGDGTGDEAVRVLKSCPLWAPGTQDGAKVNVVMKMPINLKI